MVLAINLPNAVYVFLSIARPDNLLVINCAVAIEQFGYGFGFTAYMLYMLYVSQGEHETAHFAICTGFMAMGVMLPGMWSGWLQELIGYEHFFHLDPDRHDSIVLGCWLASELIPSSVRRAQKATRKNHLDENGPCSLLPTHVLSWRLALRRQITALQVVGAISARPMFLSVARVAITPIAFPRSSAQNAEPYWHFVRGGRTAVQTPVTSTGELAT